MKTLLFLTIFGVFVNASMLLDKSYPLCIEDYYYNSGSLYYLRSSDSVWGSTTANYTAQYIFYGYDYNSTSSICSRTPNSILASSLGLSFNDFNMFLAFSAILFTSIIIMILSLFVLGF